MISARAAPTSAPVVGLHSHCLHNYIVCCYAARARACPWQLSAPAASVDPATTGDKCKVSIEIAIWPTNLSCRALWARVTARDWTAIATMIHRQSARARLTVQYETSRTNCRTGQWTVFRPLNQFLLSALWRLSIVTAIFKMSCIRQLGCCVHRSKRCWFIIFWTLIWSILKRI